MNQALQWIDQQLPPAEVVRRLVARLGMSRRQAYRYVEQAQATSIPLTIPETKDVFTVKLPQSLIRKVRRHARRQKQPISQWVAQVLQNALEHPQAHG